MIEAVGSCEDGNGHPDALWIERCRNDTRRHVELGHGAAFCHVDDTDRAAIVGRPGRHEPVAAPSNDGDTAGSTTTRDLVKHLAGTHIPDPGEAVGAGGGEQLAVATECEAGHGGRRGR